MSTSGGAAVGRDEASDEYTGALGATRRERVLLPSADGAGRSVELVVGVHAGTDPLLAARARAGVLHRVEPFGDLAVSFVYHDPALRCFVMVLPTARAHEELALRAQWLGELARATTAAMPAYVRAGTSVLGSSGLCAHLTKLRRALDDAARAAATAPAPRRPTSLVPEGDFATEAAMLDEHDATEVHELEPAVDHGADAALDALDALGVDDGLDPLDAVEVDDSELLSPRALPTGPATAAGAPRRAGFAAAIDGEAHLWCVLEHAHGARLVGAALEFSVETDDGPFPLALLEVHLRTDDAAQAPLARAALDATRPEDRAVLEALTRAARVRLEAITPEGHTLGTHLAQSPGAEAALHELLRTLRARGPGDDEARGALAERWCAEGLPKHSARREPLPQRSSLAKMAMASEATRPEQAVGERDAQP